MSDTIEFAPGVKRPIGKGAVEVTSDIFSTRATIDAGVMVDRLSSEIATRLDLLMREGLPLDEIADEMEAFLSKLSDKPIGDIARRATSTAFNYGRNLEIQRQATQIAFVIRTEIIDPNTCPTCESLDGNKYDPNSELYWEFMPPNKCEGGDRCRGFYLAVGDLPEEAYDERVVVQALEEDFDEAKHPRDDSGKFAPAGGGGGEDKGDGDSVAKGGRGALLRDSGGLGEGNDEQVITQWLQSAPGEHRTGIEYISVEETEELKGGAIATYTTRNGRITLCLESDKNDFMHEVGHHVHLARMTSVAARDWEGISQRGSTARVSAYARCGTTEHFAEAYASYAAGGNLRARLGRLEPKTFAFMERVFNPASELLFPNGRLAPLGQRYDRYGTNKEVSKLWAGEML